MSRYESGSHNTVNRRIRVLRRASPTPRERVVRQAKRIKLLLMDVDGVLNDGRFGLLSQPDGATTELQFFHSRDGAGLKLLRRAGLRTGLITGRKSAAVAARAQELNIDFIRQDAFEKLPAYEDIKRAASLTDAEIAFIGDDVTDLPLLRRVGLAVAVATAHPETKRVAHYITRAPGGHGAVREVCDLLLRAQGKYQKILRAFAR